MSHAAWKRVGCFVLVIGAVWLLSVTFEPYTTIQRVHARTTQAYMVRIDSLLSEYQPRIDDAPSFRTFLRQHDAEKYFRDGWGRPFVIETRVDKTNGLKRYRIISLGRSGRRSSCCKPDIGHHWDLNAVMDNTDIRQMWSY
jgi:hypothetical protein